MYYLERTEFVLFIIEGSAVIFINTVVMFLIFFARHLSKCQELIFIGGLCLADTVDALGYLGAGIVRTHIFATGQADLTVEQLRCFLTFYMIFFFIGYQFTALMTFIVSFDRFIAVFYPTYQLYPHKRLRYLIIALAALWSIIGFFSAWVFQLHHYSSELQVPVHCYVAQSNAQPVWAYLIGLRVVCITASVVIYIPIGFKIRHVLRDRNGHPASMQNRKLVRITITIAITSLIALTLLVIPDILVLFDIAGLSRYHVFFYLIGLNKCFANIFVYTFRQHELRKTLVDYLKNDRQIESNFLWAEQSPRKKEFIFLPTMLEMTTELKQIEFILYIVEGAIIIVINIPVIILIFFSKRLSECHELVLVAGLCLADTIDAFGYFTAGIKRTAMYAVGMGETQDNNLNCFFQPHLISFFIGYQLTAILTSLLSFECFSAVFFPYQHVKVTRRARCLVIIGAFVWSIVTYIVTYVFFMRGSTGGSISAFCFMAEILPSQVFNFLLGQRLLLITASVAVYIPIVFRMKALLKNNALRQQTATRAKKFRKLTTTVGITSLIALCLLVIPDVLLFFDVCGITKYHVLFYLNGLNKCLLDSFVYTLRHGELRKAFWYYISKILCVKKTGSVNNSTTVRAVQIK
ncbi:hypothetical protein QR680_015778 [Steinernema hermaphroditum]|uniref:G-protein coupled receptors family 1 profile domain-containing protein n=1 Tax=Steinernema hermaphroditum TaxID=289476 RepID=A0AA39HBH5_9BILA|nr:hypothetical protein QR680_015778 [Steinernema hermaphroditum]